jgi:putative PEP-CTERM system TPR-repeat lipoprotein
MFSRKKSNTTAIALAAAVVIAVLVAVGFAARKGPPTTQQLLSTGQARLERGEVVGAIIDARALLQVQSESGAGRLLLARALLAQGDLAGAETELQRAERFGITAADLAVPQARLALAQGRAADVVQTFGAQTGSGGSAGSAAPAATAASAGSAASAAFAANAELMTLVAQAHRELRDLPAARQQLDRVLATSPQYLPALALRARLRAEAGDVAGAIAEAEALTRDHAAAASAWLTLADLQAQQPGERAAQSLAAYRKAAELGPRLADAQAGVVRQLLLQGQIDAARAQVATLRKSVPDAPLVDYLDGMTAYLAGDLPRAREMVELLGKRAEPTPATQLLAGKVYARLGLHVQAETQLTAAVNAAPQWTEPRRELAATYLRLGRPERALELLKPVLVAHADDAGLWSLAGQVHARVGDFSQADIAFERARALRPGDAAIRAAAARSQIDRGNVGAGLAELEASARSDTDGVSVDLALVSAQMRAGNRSAALRALDAAERKQPQAALPVFLRGRVLEGSGDVAGARAAYERALSKEPRMRAAVDALAALDLAARKPDAARQRYAELLKAEPQSASAMLAMAEVLLRSGARVADVNAWVDKSVRADPKDVANWRAAIDLQRRLGDPAQLLARAQAADVAVPEDHGLLLDLAAAQGQAGVQGAVIVTTLRRAVRLQPQDVEGQLRLAVAHGAAGDLDGAREPLKRALQLAPDAMEVRRAAVMLALADRRPERARSLVAEAQTRRPADALGWDLEAELEAALGNKREAAAAARTALERSNSPERAVALHRALAAVDARAAQQFQDSRLKSHPADLLFAAYLAEVAQRAGRREEAEARYQGILRADANHVFALNNLAELLLQRRRPEALALAERAAHLLPHAPAVLDTLASAQAQALQAEAALKTQQRAVELLPGDPAMRLRLARYLVARGDRDKAREELQRAMRPEVPQPIRQEAEQLHRQLG